MTFRLPWQREPAKLWPTDKIISCPHCKNAAAPSFSIAIGRHAVEREGVIVIVETGERLVCWGCSRPYGIGPQGVFTVHEKAYPPDPILRPIMEPPPSKIAGAAMPEVDPEDAKPRPPLPLGLKRP